MGVSDDWLLALAEAGVAAPNVQAEVAAALHDDLQIEECLKARRGVVIYRASLRGRRLIVKQGVPNAAEVLQEMRAARLRMAGGPNDVVAPVVAVNDILVMDEAPGQPMQLALDDLGPGDTRNARMARVGDWALSYTGGNYDTGVFGKTYWFRKRSEEIAKARVAEEMRGALQNVMAWLERHAERIAGAPVTKGTVHGDLTPMNLHLDDKDILWGFDVGTGPRMPIARDLARFMVTWARSSNLPDGLGLEEAMALARPVLRDDELTTLLPFFLGEQIAGRLAEQMPDGVRARRIQQMAVTLMETYP
ncbi:hypothetical protein FIU81_00475 [Palleronia sp. THAF1]|nr:hypothetical protein FIU81_00475 [Palleronia sp. THAF1]